MQGKLEKPWIFYLSQNKFLKIWENYIRVLQTRRRSYGGGFLREMWEHGDISPSYATEISDDARVAVSRTRDARGATSRKEKR
jgi:hypothetical protein